MADDTPADSARRHRPKATTVFIAAFVAGAVVAVVVNRALDLHLAQSRPQVESEPIFVALRPLPQGSPVTVWDVALRDWPRAMLPTSALRAGDSFEGSVLKYALREGQPLLAVQLMPASPPLAAAADMSTPVEDAFVMPAPAAAPTTVVQPAVAVAPKLEPPREPAAAPKTSPVAAGPAVDPTAPIITTAEPSHDATQPSPSAVAETTTTPAQEPAVTEPTLAKVEPQPTRVASNVEPLLNMPSRPAVDLESIPSVMARSETPAKPAETAPMAGPVRYLVVPERIARQADTSFVSPPAVEPVGEPTPPPPVAVSQPPAVKAPQAAPQRSAQAATARTTKAGAPRSPPAAAPKSSQAAAPKSAQSAARSTPQQRTTRSASGATSTTQQRPPKQPQQSQQAKRQATKPPQGQPSDRERAEPAPRTRGGMFPAISAGIEAVGDRWRGDGDEAVATDIPSGQRRK